jgi:serine phosphatase RsbU (regulator of sigma subunit)
MMCNVNAIRQTRFVDEMHTRLREFSARGAFATALIGTFFAPTKSLTLCNAGHPTPLVYRANTGTWSVVKQSPSPEAGLVDAPLGVLGQDEYQQITTRLDCGDMLLGFSNVLTECRGPDGTTLGLSGFLKQLARLDPHKPASLVSTLVSQLEYNNSDTLNEHDSTIVLCRATERAVGWKDSVLAPLRLLRSVADNTHLR